MKKKILSHTGIMIVLTAILTFVAASFVMYDKFNAEMKKDDKTKAVEIQCGMIAFEDAIKDYIERYAFPIKIQSMLETYEYILDDVSKFISADTKNLEKLKKKMEKKQGVQGEIKKNQEEIERKKAN